MAKGDVCFTVGIIISYNKKNCKQSVFVKKY